MNPISYILHDAEIGHESSDIDIGEDEAIRKVEGANRPDLNAQSGVQKVEAVTLAWTKTSLACAFVWYVLIYCNLHAGKWITSSYNYPTL
jgi:hypothetical protein